jgi:hypothetical protein
MPTTQVQSQTGQDPPPLRAVSGGSGQTPLGHARSSTAGEYQEVENSGMRQCRGYRARGVCFRYARWA